MTQAELQLVLGAPFKETRFKITLNRITWFVGPNGSGKTKFAEALASATGGGKARILRADRLAGLELVRSGYFTTGHFSQGFQKNTFENLKQDAARWGYGADAIILLEENYALRTMVEATLTQIFGRRVMFEWDSGILKPTVLQQDQLTPYSLHQDECHGLKELVVLLTHLYDPTKEVLIIDEPELNLHPQFQSYVLEQVKNVVQRLDKKVVLITHSPYMIDVRNETDLENLYCFNGNGNLPQKVSVIDGIEIAKVRRCLSQMNAHHRQIFFANYLLLVEGVYDRLVLTAYLERLGRSISAAGGTIIDVNGKDEIPFYLRFAEQLGKQVFIFTDIDALFDGSVRRILSKDRELISALSDCGGGSDVSDYVGTIQRELHAFFAEIQSLPTPNHSEISAEIARSLTGASNETKNEKFLAKAILSQPDCIWPTDLRMKVSSLRGRLRTIISAFWHGVKVQFFERGELEDYLFNGPIGKAIYSDQEKQTLSGNALSIMYDPCSDIDLLLPHVRELKSYIDLLPKQLAVDYWIPLEELAKELVHFIQRHAASGEFKTKQDLERVLPLKFRNVLTVMEVVGFQCEPRSQQEAIKFNGVLKFAFQGLGKVIHFDHDTPVHRMKLVSDVSHV